MTLIGGKLPRMHADDRGYAGSRRGDVACYVSTQSSISVHQQNQWLDSYLLFERGEVPDLAAKLLRLQQPADDLAAARLGQLVRERNLRRNSNGSQHVPDVVFQFGFKFRPRGIVPPPDHNCLDV